MSTLDIFLLIGQSNMAGRGRLEDVPRLSHPQILMYREGHWLPAEEPLHADKPDVAGIGLGMSFAVEVLTACPDRTIGLLPCAVGGTPLSRWVPGADLYENALNVTRRALADGALAGILWHQGEGDSSDVSDAASYGERFTRMIGSLRGDLNANNVPVVAGELGWFLAERDPCSHFALINRQLNDLRATLPLYGCASSADLMDNGDLLHFNAEALREFGARYAREYLALAR